ncbi:hypothetical protein H5410_022808 [Solanum commersonii]|uniref:Uncharacterized protein n=1 Tax=Solanum commersonii TaxID=4109 RepID=A0A9J5ZHU8_SOLCO|nr:hypothetical protein H5410_022808 [Solanum commersonii]
MDPKGKNIASGLGTKRSRKGAGTGSSSREPNNLPPKIWRASCLHYGKNWYECQQESKYLGDEYIDEGRLRQEFPNILAKINALGLQYVFMDQGECTLSLVCEFYVNWNTRRVEINKGFIRDSWVRFYIEALDEFLSTLNCDDAELLGGHPVTEDEMDTLAKRYLLMDWAMYMCQIGPAFQEPINDDNATGDDEDGSVEDESDDTGLGDDDTNAGDGFGFIRK